MSPDNIVNKMAVACTLEDMDYISAKSIWIIGAVLCDASLESIHHPIHHGQ